MANKNPNILSTAVPLLPKHMSEVRNAARPKSIHDKTMIIKILVYACIGCLS